METNLPTQKVVATTLAVALMQIFVYILEDFVIATEIPGNIEGAITVVMTFLVGYFVPPHPRDRLHENQTS